MPGQSFRADNCRPNVPRRVGLPTGAGLLVVLGLFTGCSAIARSHGGDLSLTPLPVPQAEKQAPAQATNLHFDTVLFSLGDGQRLTIVFLVGSVDEPKQALVVRTLWQRATMSMPSSKAATNASLRYLAFAPDAEPALDVYTGGGQVRGKLDGARKSFSGSIADVCLHLTDAVAPEHPGQLPPLLAAGSFSARRDEVNVPRVLRQLSQQATTVLGYPVLVRLPAPLAESLDAG
ncbi:MAG: hypothetical protein IT443_03740 [Phycisphaeraceae bacterium]|nr:hypothetical protein [Phycisphaeraceae bacterium]